MNKKVVIVFIFLIVLFAVASLIITPLPVEKEPIQVVMKDAVLHNLNKVEYFNMEVNPAVISSFIVTLFVLAIALIIRIFFIPKFKYVPNNLQLSIEMVVGYFKNLAIENSPHRNKFLGAYIFAAGVYIFCSTMFELFGVQVLTTEGHSLSLPAPLADINGAVSLGVLSYLVILSGGLITNGIKGVGKALKDFSLPVSMSFRLFGALLSGLLVNELIYHYIFLSYLLPVIVAVLFTLLHAVIQAYVLTMLTSLFYGEVTEKHHKEVVEVKQETI